MRKELCDALLQRANKSNVVFLTGDLGFMALEPLQAVMGERFINAGVAEQNMVSVAAALAKQDLEVWVYSIAPFCYARPFEQIRNDIALHNLPVKLIGNGGGYGYGVMGPTHHAIEDYGVLLSLPNMRVYVPAFDVDVSSVVERAATSSTPAYIRIGRGEAPENYQPPKYRAWRQLAAGGGPVVIAIGPIAGLYTAEFNSMPSDRRPNFWVVSELPLAMNPLPDDLISQIKLSDRLVVAEEHIQHGGFGADLLIYLAENNIKIPRFNHLYARAHCYDRYGSQKYLRTHSGLDADSMAYILGAI